MIRLMLWSITITEDITLEEDVIFNLNKSSNFESLQ